MGSLTPVDRGEQAAEALGGQLARLLADVTAPPSPMLAEDLAYELAAEPLERREPTRPVPAAEQPPLPASGV